MRDGLMPVVCPIHVSRIPSYQLSKSLARIPVQRALKPEDLIVSLSYNRTCR